MSHQTRHPKRPELREQTAEGKNGRHEYYCRIGEHGFNLEEADYCETCGNFICPEHGHDCGFAQRLED